MHQFVRSSRTLVLAGVLAVVGTSAPAAAQFSIMDPAAQTVMSSRDFNALLEAIAFDPSQRATAGPLFDDAQRELIAARDDLAATPTPAANADARELSDHEARKRRAYQRMASAEQAFFDGLAAFATPQQQPLVERERLAAARRLVRRTLGHAQASQGPVRVDLVTSVQESKLSAAEQAAALTALGGYQTQLTALLQQALDQGLEVDAKAAKLREQKGVKTGGEMRLEPDADGNLTVSGDSSRREAAVAFDATLDRIAAQHQQAMAALESALSPMAADSINSAVARRIWPRAALDMRSPRATFAQLRDEIARGKRPADQLAALDAAQPSWLSAWWTSTRKACEAENGLRRYGLFGGMNEETKPIREKMKTAREERDAADRVAWRALAALDKEHAGFYAAFIEPPSSNREMMFSGGPGEPTPPRLAGDEAPGGTSVASTFSSAAMIMVRNDSDGEDDTMSMPIVMEAGGDGPISISMGPDGIATFMSDSVGDGMVGQDVGVVFEEPGEPASQLSGARLPAPMTRDQAADIARAVAATSRARAAAEPSTMDQLYTDYAERAKALDDSAGAAARELLAGSTRPPMMHVAEPNGGDEDAPRQRTMEELRAGISKLDAYEAQLAAIDDAFIANLAAACAPEATEAQTAALRQERARDRIRQVSYPSSPMFAFESRGTPKAMDLGKVVRQTPLTGADRQAADTVVAEWSPAAVAALEQARGTLRGVSLKLLAAERRMFERMEKARATAPKNAEGGVVMQAIQVDDRDDMEAQQALMKEATTAGKAEQELARGTQERLAGMLSPEGKTALLAAWCRAVAPQAFEDKRNADARLTQALALVDLTPEQHRQIDALRASHAAEHAALTEKIGSIAAGIALSGADSQDGDAGQTGSVARRQALDRYRFDRSELNERTLRRLRTLLTPAQAEKIPSLGHTFKAPGLEVRTGS